MDKLLWPNGGVELHSEDFIFAEEAIRSALAGMLSSVQPSNTVLVLSGCVVSFNQGNASVTAGWIVLDGEILYMPAQTVSTQVGQTFTNKAYIALNAFNDAAGAEVLASGATGQTYQRRQASIVGGNSGDWRDSASWVTYDKRINALAASGLSSVVIPGNDLNAPFTLPSGVTIEARKSSGLTVLKGALNLTGLAANTSFVAFTLPVGFRPTGYNAIQIIPTFDSGTSTLIGTIFVATNGDVSFKFNNTGVTRVDFSVTYW
jgi:hypothetical protein